MCGRFTQKYTWSELADLYALTQPPRNLEPRYNIAPTTMVDVIRELVPMRWGLIPAWWKKTIKDLPATFNARAETVSLSGQSG
jgi:putative SOS response-associated peptidase YedK